VLFVYLVAVNSVAFSWNLFVCLYALTYCFDCLLLLVGVCYC